MARCVSFLITSENSIKKKRAKSVSHQTEKLLLKTYTHKLVGFTLPLGQIPIFSFCGGMNKRYAIVTSTNCYTSITLVTINKLTINKLSLLPKQKCKLVKEHISTTYLTPHKFPRTHLPKRTSLKCICAGKGGI